MAFDIKTALASIAPTIATMLGGPLAGTAVTSLEGALGLTPGSGEDGITKVLQAGALTPDQITAVRAADQRHAEVMGQQGIDLAKLNADTAAASEQVAVNNTIDARKNNSGRNETWSIAVVILLTFAAVMCAVLWGCWLLLQGGITIKDVSVVAAISGLVGSIVGYVAANAQTVVNFIFGGSMGSESKTKALSDAVNTAIQATGTKS